MSIESVMPSNYLILCYPLLLLPSIFPSIRVFSNESALRIRWSKYWSFRSFTFANNAAIKFVELIQQILNSILGNIRKVLFLKNLTLSPDISSVYTYSFHYLGLIYRSLFSPISFSQSFLKPLQLGFYLNYSH